MSLRTFSRSIFLSCASLVSGDGVVDVLVFDIMLIFCSFCTVNTVNKVITEPMS